MKNNIPSLRIAVTSDCNLSCPYCPKDGDSYITTKRQLTLNEYLTIIKAAYQTGIRHFSITGGEPLLTPKITFSLAKHINSFESLEYLRLNTNGTLILNHIEKLKKSKFQLIKVSLDNILNPNENNVNTIKGILKLREIQQNVRINMVVSKSNIHELEAMIQFCETNGIQLKLFDLTYYQNTNSNDENFWQNNFISLKTISKKLSQKYGRPQIIHTIGGYGNPMPVFNSKSESSIRLRISENSAFYMPNCTQCNDYMCQDGLSNLTLSADGKLKLCRPLGLDLGLDFINSANQLIPDKHILKKFHHALYLFKNSKQIIR